MSLFEYLKKGEAPQRDYFDRELHPEERPVQAARFGRWNAVCSGIDWQTEIHDLADDAAEADDQAGSGADLVSQAEDLFRQQVPYWW